MLTYACMLLSRMLRDKLCLIALANHHLPAGAG